MSQNYGELPPRNNSNPSQHPTPPQDKTDKVSLEQLNRLRKQADQGSQAAIDEINRVQESREEVLGQFRGDLCLHIRRAIAGTASCGDVDMREAVLASQEELRAELAGPQATPLQRMVIDRLLNSCLDMDSLDLEAATRQSCEPGKANELSAVRNHAHLRFYRAVTALAGLQRTEKPVRAEVSIEEQIRVLNEAADALSEAKSAKQAG